MNKFLTVTGFVVLASPAFAQGMAAPSGSMAAPSHMAAANDTMKMDHKKSMKTHAVKHAAMAAPQTGMAGGMASGSMSGPNH